MRRRRHRPRGGACVLTWSQIKSSLGLVEALPHAPTTCTVGEDASGLRPSRSPPRGRLPPWNPRSRRPPQSACHRCMPLGAESGRCVPRPTPAAGHSISGPARFASSLSLFRAFVSRLPFRVFAPSLSRLPFRVFALSFRVFRPVSRLSRSKPTSHSPHGLRSGVVGGAPYRQAHP